MKICFYLFIAFQCVSLSFAKTIYVKPSAVGNGTSWTSAYGDLQRALDAASSGDQIWVAAGIYAPSVPVGGTTSRHQTFQMKNGVAIYGGFAGTESILSQRDIYNNETILSGDLNGDDGPSFENYEENCFHVFYHPIGTNLNTTAVLDGFTITAGNANTGSDASFGGGMFNAKCSPTVANCTFIANYAADGGGGMANQQIDCNPLVTNCTFEGNYAGRFGGGMGNHNSCDPTITNCIFFGNTVEHTGGGGGISFDNGNPSMTNCTISGNTAPYGGGVFIGYYSSASLINCIIWGNASLISGNEILKHQTCSVLIAYSNINGSGAGWDSSLGTDGGGNMDENPYFDAYLQLQATSPCIDAADGDAAPATDLFGNARYNDPATSNIGTGYPNYADMGACEYQGLTTISKPAMFINSLGASNVSITSCTGHSGTTTYLKTVNEGTNVSLTAPAVWGLATFTGWTGSVTSSSTTISLPTDISKFVRAKYETSASTTYPLYVYSSGASSVEITSGTGHSGTTTYSTQAIAGTSVTLTAPAAWEGMTFTGWTGAVTSSNRTVSVNMIASKYVFVNYELNVFHGFDEDRDVDLSDFQILAAAWMSKSSSANWNEACDLDTNGIVD
ncbi:MAG: right-handed parallel beta-helix repeat-containing protein, partial [Planctomycetota bacterium]